MNKALLVLVLIFGVSAAANGQARHYTTQSLGMGSGGTAYVEGYNANFVNPANLMLDKYGKRTTIGLAQVGFKAGGSLANISVYNEYMTSGNVIEGPLRENLLNDWFGDSPENMRELSTTTSINPIGVSHRRNNQAFSLASRVRVTENFSISKGTAQLMLYGLDSEVFANPVPVNFTNYAIAFGEISVGYARYLDFVKIPDLFFAKDIKLYVGVAPKYLYGLYAADFTFNSTIQIEPATATTPFTIHHRFNYELSTVGTLSEQLQQFEAAYNADSDAKLDDYVDYSGDDLGPAQATGFGLDIGGTLEMDISAVPIPLFINKEKTLRISMSLTDLGKLSYDKTPSRVYADAEFSYLGAQDGDEFGSFFEDLADSLQNDVYGQFSSEPISSLDYQLPGMYNFGASLEMGKLLLALDYGLGFNKNGINSDRSTLSLGAQYRLFGFVPIRVGTRLGGYSSAAYSAGIGLDFNAFEFTVAVSNVGNSQNYGSAAGVAWSGLVIRF